MEQIVLVVHLLIALAIIGLIMLQQGKGADMGASFGAGASQTLFGSDGSGNVLTKATAWLVVLFFASSFGLALIASQRSAPVDDLGLDIPVPVESEQRVPVDDELPQLDTVTPAVTADDLPQLDAVAPATGGDDDLPQLD
ncbi:MAG: preprotein translocase subunit SecG [Halioglobus sp.]|nr:preprotein translocase subunit SecG [Halioglobus sp.]